MLGLGSVARKMFGTPNDRKIKSTRAVIDQINALEPEFEAMSDDALIRKTHELRDALNAGKTLDDILPEAFANCREAARRALGLRAFVAQRDVGAVDGGDHRARILRKGRNGGGQGQKGGERAEFQHRDGPFKQGRGASR